jgi:6-phospho-3-hexuloisomerase
MPADEKPAARARTSTPPGADDLATDPLLRTVLDEVSTALSAADAGQVQRLVEVLADSERVLVTGEGRSGLMAKAFAMRLMHLGLRVHVVGETTTPAVAAGDTVVAVSGSGTTGATVRAAEQARALGAAVHAVTADTGSPLADLADSVLLVPAATKHRRAHEAATVQPLSSLFDQAAHLLLDVVCLHLARRRQVGHGEAMAAHANTE